jgi:hypothetical protein
MKVRIYFRVGRSARSPRQPRFAVGRKPNPAALTNARNEPIPTVGFAIDLDVPDALFEQPSRVVAELTIPEPAADVLAIVREVAP